MHSINYITCHDGFTLNDLVSYRDKHNEANGEDNRDGWEHNLSWNCGTEGDTLDEATLRLRGQHARNAMALLLLSQGVPMLLAGDEVLRTQRGNNNAWCQDNETSWFDWRLTETNGDMLNFVRQLIALRRRHPTLSRRQFLTGEPDPARGIPDIAWHGARARRDALGRRVALPRVHAGRLQRGGRRPARPDQHVGPERVRGPAGNPRTALAPGRGHGRGSRPGHRRAGRADRLDGTPLPQPAAERGGAGGALVDLRAGAGQSRLAVAMDPRRPGGFQQITVQSSQRQSKAKGQFQIRSIVGR